MPKLYFLLVGCADTSSPNSKSTFPRPGGQIPSNDDIQIGSQIASSKGYEVVIFLIDPWFTKNRPNQMEHVIVCPVSDIQFSLHVEHDDMVIVMNYASFFNSEIGAIIGTPKFYFHGIGGCMAKPINITKTVYTLFNLDGYNCQKYQTSISERDYLLDGIQTIIEYKLNPNGSQVLDPITSTPLLFSCLKIKLDFPNSNPMIGFKINGKIRSKMMETFICEMNEILVTLGIISNPIQDDKEWAAILDTIQQTTKLYQ